MNPSTRSFWYWPDWRDFVYALVLNAGLWLWFGLIYGGTDYLATLHHHRVRLHLDAELAIPFVPWTVFVYMSIYLTFWMAPFVLRTRSELQGLVLTLAAVILIGGVCFLVLPSELKYPPPGAMGNWTGLVRLARDLALTNNFAPSMHVTLSTVCIVVYARQAPRPGKGLLYGWAAAIGGSTLLLHQHYVVDVLSGYLLAVAGVRGVYDRRVPRAG
jgi:membrane-associated phospholipid phosphatase